MSDPEAREFIATIPEPIAYAERSMSGEGVHIFVLAPEARGYRRGRVEFYSRARFIRMTGVRFETTVRPPHASGIGMNLSAVQRDRTLVCECV